MGKYAQYDSGPTEPSPVIGWYDTDIFGYADFQLLKNLIEVTDSQWAMHFTNPNGWAVKNGQLIEDTTPVKIK